MPGRHEQIQILCPNCGRVTVHDSYVQECNHIAYILASVFLCGLALPLWLVAALREGRSPWHCVQCGYEHPKKAPSVAAARSEVVSDSRPKPLTHIVRVWTHVSGRKLEGRFIDAGAGRVRLERNDGAIVEFEVDKLSEDDRALVELHLAQGG